MMSPSPFQVRVVTSVELHCPLNGVAGCGIRRWWRPTFSGRAWLGNWRRHGSHSWKVTMVVVMLLVMVVVVMIVHVQVRRRVQPRAGDRLVLRTAGLRCFYFDVGHLKRLVFERRENVWVYYLVHLVPRRRFLRFVRMMAVQTRIDGPRDYPGRFEKVTHDRLVSRLDCMLVFYHKSL